MTSLGEAEKGDLMVGREDERIPVLNTDCTSVSRKVWQPQLIEERKFCADRWRADRGKLWRLLRILKAERAGINSVGKS